jgi:hypothetical protein
MCNVELYYFYNSICFTTGAYKDNCALFCNQKNNNNYVVD